MGRERLDEALSQLWDRRVGLVVAPAGSGKTTLLNQFAVSAQVPVAWYRAEARDASVDTLLHTLWLSISSALEGVPEGGPCVEDLVAALDEWPGERALLVVDDFHTLRGTPAEEAIEQLIDYAPAGLRLLFASRCACGFNLSRLRVSGDLVEIGPDALRFRSWEVERLFRDFYNEPLPPEDLAELARRTEGWAAGLQLFHLATKGKPISERRQILTELGTRSRMVQEYLARNVLNDLPEDLRGFLLRTCVLGQLTGPLCDQLLEGSGSEKMLQELERRQIFTVALGDTGVYRYHEVLRSYLEGMLIEAVGEAEARARYHRAGQLLQTAGALPEALRAYCRAEDWEAAGRLLGRDGEQLAADQGDWLNALPPALLEQDPWLLLATARRYLALGRPQAALGAYQQAEKAFGPTSSGDVSRRERQTLATWLDPSLAVPAGWLGLLRSATQRDPLTAAGRAAALPEAAGQLTAGVAMLLAGHVAQGRQLLLAASEDNRTSPVLAVVARAVAETVGTTCSTQPSLSTPLSERAALAAEEAESLNLAWLAQLCRTLAVLHGREGRAEAAAMRQACLRHGDLWGAAVLALLEGVAGLWAKEPAVECFEEAVFGFRRLGAGVIEAWARGGLAVAMAMESHPETREAALSAERWTRSAGVPGAAILAFIALGLLGGEQADEYLALAQAQAQEYGIRWPFPLAPAEMGPLGVVAPTSVALPPTPPIADIDPSEADNDRAVPSVVVSCLGGFRLQIAGQVLDHLQVKPRARAALHVLALHAGRPVHRESLVEALWPDSDARVGARNLHVAISSLRRLLSSTSASGPTSTSTSTSDASRRESSLIAREGDAYRLALPEGAVVDLWTFTARLAEARAARAAGDLDRAVAATEGALDSYAGELLPEDGPAEWVVAERERYRANAADAAQTLAELRLEQGQPELAVAACERGLTIDHYRDALWRLLVRACEAAGDPAAAARAARAYKDVLTELGLSTSSNFQ